MRLAVAASPEQGVTITVENRLPPYWDVRFGQRARNVTSTEERVRGYSVIENTTADRLELEYVVDNERTNRNRLIGIVGALAVSLTLWAGIIVLIVAVN